MTMLRNSKFNQVLRVAGKGQIRCGSTVKTTPYDTRDLSIPGNATVFSLIQPTGRFHLGNYLGAVRVWKDICEKAPLTSRLIFGVADLHAMTIPKSAKELKDNRYEAIASILSSGLNPEKAIIYHQSAIAEHTELYWILSCHAGAGYLNRMTQWKSKSEGLESASLGLFAYPVLQSADILLYKSTHVPVGDDQSQHLELTRHLATQFNKHYRKTFPLPTTILAPTKKILSLRDPSKKMSKSDPDQNGTLYITDDPDVLAQKIRKAVTDSTSTYFNYDPENRPGVSNMINIVSGIQRKTIEEVEKDMANIHDHKDFKNYITEAIVEEFKQPRDLFNQLMKNKEYLERVVIRGNVKAREIAVQTMEEVRKNSGLDTMFKFTEKDEDSF